METKRNIKYFTAPPISVVSIVGWAILAIGAVFLIIGDPLTLAGVIVAIAGLTTVIVSSGGKSTDTDIEFQIRGKTKDLQEQSEKKFEVYEKNFLKMLKPSDLRGYDFEASEQPFYYKKGADGVHRTNYFVGCNLIFTNEKMFVYSRRFSLIDEEADAVDAKTFLFNELDRAEIEEKAYTYKKKDRDVSVKYYIFKILKEDGESAVSMCVDYGADIDKYVDQISRAIVTRKKELAKRAQEAAERRAAFRAQIEAEREAIARGEMNADE